MACKNCGCEKGQFMFNDCGQGFIECVECGEIHTENNWDRED